MNRNAPLAVTAGLVILAALFIAIGAVYFAEPAHSLPSVFPGHVSATATDAGHHHTKHGIASFAVAVVCLAGAWMTTGRKTDRTPGAD